MKYAPIPINYYYRNQHILVSMKNVNGASPMSNPLYRLPQALIEERGTPEVGVAISRSGGKVVYVKYSVGEFLSQPENMSGEWYIDGGWGGPPGPIKVVWNGHYWENHGFPPWN